MTNVAFEGPDGLSFVEDDSPSVFPDHSCGVCGRELTYSGRGRKPRKCSATNDGDPDCYSITNPRAAAGTRTTRGSGKTVDAAVASMEGIYDGMSQALMLVAPAGAAELERRLPVQRERNRSAFISNPALAERVASWGGKGGLLMFIVSNALFVGGIARASYAEAAQTAALVSMLASAGGNGGNSPEETAANLGSLFGNFL